MPLIHRRYFTLFLVTFAWHSFAATRVTLEDAFKAAASRDEAVLQSKERIYQADSVVSQVRGSIFPKLEFGLTHQIQPLPSDPVAAQFSPENQTQANFTLRQPLFRGFAEWKGLSQAQHLRSAEEAGYDASLNKLFRDTVTAYVEILKQEKDLANLNEQSSIYEKRVKELSGRVKRGESNQTDVVTAEATQATLEGDIRLTQAELEIARQKFGSLTGLNNNASLVDPNLHGSFRLQPLDKYLERLTQRPDVREALQKFEAAQKGSSVAWGAHLPRADVIGNYYLERPGFLSDLKWDVRLEVTVPLFEGFVTQAKYSEAVSRRKDAELEFEKVKRAARMEVVSLYQRLNAKLDQLRSLRKAAELSRRNATLVQKDARRGLTRNIDVQLALTEFRIAQRTFDQAHFSSQIDVYELLSAAAMAPIKTKGSY